MFEGVDWSSVGIAAALATALATGTSTLTALWWRRQDRAQPDWFISGTRSAWIKDESGSGDEGPKVSFTLSNTGDASAFRMTATGLGCRARMFETERSTGGYLTETPVWVMAPPGDSQSVILWCEPNDWDAAEVRFEWVQSPTWKNRTEELLIPLRSIAKRPTLMRRFLDETTLGIETEPMDPPPGPALSSRHAPDHPLRGTANRPRLPLPRRRRVSIR